MVKRITDSAYREIEEIIDNTRDAAIYGDVDSVCDGLDRIKEILMNGE